MGSGTPKDRRCEDNVLLRLGPDSAQKITCWAGTPTVSLMAAFLAFLLPALSGPVVLMWALILWYCLRSGWLPSVTVSERFLRVRTPARTFSTPWGCVSDMRYGPHIIVRLSSGHDFRLPQYTATIVTSSLARSTSLFSARGRLELALGEAWHAAPVEQQSEGVAPQIRWTYPSAPVVSAMILAAVGVEVCTLLFR
jgi:hypothetical protein